jgi:hypothetical protein
LKSFAFLPFSLSINKPTTYVFCAQIQFKSFTSLSSSLPFNQPASQPVIQPASFSPSLLFFSVSFFLNSLVPGLLVDGEEGGLCSYRPLVYCFRTAYD